MGYSLLFNGSTQYAASVGGNDRTYSIRPTTGKYRIIFSRLQYWGAHTGPVVWHCYNGCKINIRTTDGQIETSPGGKFIGKPVPNDGTPFKLEVEWDIDNGTVGYWIDDVFQQEFTGIDNGFSLHAAGTLNRTMFCRRQHLDSAYMSAEISGTVTIWEDDADNGFIYDFDASGPSGNEIIETVQGRNAALTGFATDGSQWNYYESAGTGGGTLYELELQAGNTVTEAVTLDIIASLNTNTSWAQSVAQASPVATAVVQALNAVTSEHTQQASAVTLQQQVQVAGVISEHRSEAAALTPTQSSAQSVILVTASQSEQGTVLSAAQQQVLTGILAEQLHQAGVQDISSLQAITYVQAEQASDATALSIDTLNGAQLITVITSEHVHNAQTAFISEVNATALIDAEMRSEASSVSVEAALSTVTLPASHVTETSALDVLMFIGTPDNLQGVQLVPLTSMYSLTPLTNPTYTLKEI
ncbi:hypothetical protein [Alteromonas sp. RKMC-009]|uniref:hypothetical protein n=1 Tax=Alteromonas sp. RKMC-009 TaxID=2267264 RepID=UPI000E6A2B83|nr:hypothetical protein [Alteromonas sp. RKMC-009]AYA64316.1 hypothetical protein DS731_10075 [Alteromonas sp. RKMC-009]